MAFRLWVKLMYIAEYGISADKGFYEYLRSIINPNKYAALVNAIKEIIE